MEYFIIDNNGQQAGPFSQDQLVQKRITPETLVWTQGMQDWTPAWKIAELKTTLEASEALRANDASQQTQQQAQTQQQMQQQAQTQQQMQQQAAQQAQQQAYQEAYQQGFQHGAAMSQGGNGFQGGNGYQPEQPSKKSNHTLWKIILGLIVFILLMLAVTNPGADAHKEKVRTEVGKAIEKATETTDNNFFSQAMRSVAKMMADNVMGEAMDQLFLYHNYIICSKGTVEFNGKEHTVSFGILGKVYTMNADDMVKALEDGDNLRIEESSTSSSSEDAPAFNGSSSSSDDENTDAADANGDNSDDGLGANVQKKLEEKANQALDKAAEKVSKKVEEKINQKLNQATDSSTVEKIIDKIFELF